MMVIKTVIASILLVVSPSAVGAWTPPTEVVAIRSYPSSNTHYFKLLNHTVNEGCSVSASHGVYVITDETGRSVSMLLTAKVSQTKVRLQVSGCAGHYAKVVEIQFGDGW